MTETTVCQLLKDLERTVHERIAAITQYVQSSNSVQPTQLSQMVSRIDSLEKEIVKLREQNLVKVEAQYDSSVIPPLIMPYPLTGIEVIPKREIVIATPERINEADRLLLNSSARRALEEEEDDIQDDVMEEFGEQGQQDEGEEEIEVEVEGEEEEDEGEELEEIEYKGATYYRDADKNVYMTNEDGEFVQVGVWSDVKNRIIVKKAET